MTRSLTLLMVLALVICPVACKRTAAALREEPPPSVVLRDDSAGLLLTWIDEKGDFHISQTVKDVPLIGRDAVRVVDPMNDEGTHDRVIVADLRTARPDGTYAVRALTRREFDQLALERRQKGGRATLATPAPTPTPTEPKAPAAPVSPDAPARPELPTAARQQVIIYGASWCGACHEAARWLRRQNVAFIERDIEADPAADAEMRTKLRQAGLRGGSIPVIDVRGTIMIGFDAGRVQSALGQAL